MGWLFGRKKKPKVPLPEGHPIDEKELLFPKGNFQKRVEPEEVKEAVGVEEPFPPIIKKEESADEEQPQFSTERGKFLYAEQEEIGPLFVKVDVYKRILGEIDSLNLSMNQLSNVSKNLEKSEFNEEKGFSKLKRVMKSIHDNSIILDKIMFKGE